MQQTMATLLIAGLLVPNGLVAATGVNAQASAPDKPGRYIIEFANADTKSKGLTKIKKKGGKIQKEFKHFQAVSAELSTTAVDDLKKDPEVLSIELDGLVQAQGDSIPWGIQKVQAPAVHKDGVQGAGVNVAVFDTGISAHPDLTIKGGVSFVDGVTSYADDNGHGTHVAGTIAAIADGNGIVGAAPEANLYAVKVMDANGSGRYSSIIEGLDWAIEHDIDVINMSFGGHENSKLLEKAIEKAYKNNILIFASAGNDGKSSDDSITFPARSPHVVAVGAVDEKAQRADFSSVGPDLELMAPGVAIQSTSNIGSYEAKSGTSMAAPHAAGVAALLWSKDLKVSSDTIRGLMNYSATELGEKAYYGNGMINANYALELYNEYVADSSKQGKKKKLKQKVSQKPAAPASENDTDPVMTIQGTTESYTLNSPHPYTDNYSNTWRISKSGATSIRVHFSNIDTESNYDFVRTSAGDSWSGSYPSGVWSTYASGSYIDVTLSTDGSVTKNGFTVDMIEYVLPTSGGNVVETYYLDSPHPYTDNYNSTWTISKSGASNIRVYFASIDTESNYDYVRTSAGDSWSGAYTGVWSSWSGSSSINVTLTSDGSVTRQGFRIEKIEYVSTAPSTDDHGNSMSSATTISLNSSLNGSINYGGDEDWFRFTPSTSGNYNFASSGSTDTYGHLFNASGTELIYNDDGAAPNFTMSYNLTAGQTYYVKVRHFSSGGTGAYSLRVTVQDDHGNSTSTATGLSIGSTLYGTIDYGGDEDYFRFTAPTSGSYTIESTGSTDMYGHLLNSSGSELASNDDGKAPNFSINYNLMAGQTYYVRARHYSSSGTGSYGVKVTAFDEGNDFATATTIGTGYTTGSIGAAGDLDFFSFTAPTTGIYTFESSGSTDVDAVLYDGNQLDLQYNGDFSEGTVNFRISQQLYAGQRYYLSVLHADEEAGTGSYIVQISQAADDHANYFGAATYVSVNSLGGSFSGTVNYAGDVDYYRFTPTTSGTVTIQSSGSNDVVAQIYDSNQQPVNGRDDINATNLNFGVYQNLTAGQTYYLVVESFEKPAVGAYTVTVSAGMVAMGNDTAVAGYDPAFLAEAFLGPLCRQSIPGSNKYCFRLDAPEANGKDYYHVHVYKNPARNEKSDHVYCLRLDNLDPCDKKKNKYNDWDDVPKTIQKGVMQNVEVREKVKSYHPDVDTWKNKIPGWALVTVAALLVVAATLSIFFPGDDVAAWAFFIRTLQMA